MLMDASDFAPLGGNKDPLTAPRGSRGPLCGHDVGGSTGLGENDRNQYCPEGLRTRIEAWLAKIVIDEEVAPDNGERS